MRPSAEVGPKAIQRIQDHEVHVAKPDPAPFQLRGRGGRHLRQPACHRQESGDIV